MSSNWCCQGWSTNLRQEAENESRLNAIFYSAWARRTPRCASFLFICRLLWLSVLFDLELLSLSAAGSEGVGDVLCGRWAVIMPASGLMSSLEGGFGHSDPFCVIGSSVLLDPVEVLSTSGNWWRICTFKCSFLCTGIVELTCNFITYYYGACPWFFYDKWAKN